MVLKDFGLPFPNPTLKAKNKDRHKFNTRVASGAHTKGRTVSEYTKKGKTRFFPENLVIFETLEISRVWLV